MKDMTKWEQKGRNTAMSSSGPKKRAGRRTAGNDAGRRAGRRTNGGAAKAGSGADSKAGGGNSKAGSGGDSNLMKAGLAVAAGLIVAALAKGVRDSDYYD